MQSQVVVRVVTGLAGDLLRLRVWASSDEDARADGAPVRLRAGEFYFEPVVRTPTAPVVVIIAQKLWRLVHVHDEHVRVAVVIEVPEGAAATGFRLEDAGPGLRRDLFEAP